MSWKPLICMPIMFTKSSTRRRNFLMLAPIWIKKEEERWRNSQREGKGKRSSWVSSLIMCNFNNWFNWTLEVKLLSTCPYLDFLVEFILVLSDRSAQKQKKKKKKKKSTLLAAMQPQSFLKAINGQAVDSYSGFFVLSLSHTGREGCLTCVSLTQNCSNVGARCVLLCDVLTVSLYNCHRYVGWHRDSQIVEWAQWFSLIQSHSFLSCCHLEVFTFHVAVTLAIHHSVFNLCVNVFCRGSFLFVQLFYKCIIFLRELNNL